MLSSLTGHIIHGGGAALGMAMMVPQGLFGVISFVGILYSVAIVGLFYIGSKRGAIAKFLRIGATKQAHEYMGDGARSGELAAQRAGDPSRLDSYLDRVGTKLADGSPDNPQALLSAFSGIGSSSPTRTLPVTSPTSAPDVGADAAAPIPEVGAGQPAPVRPDGADPMPESGGGPAPADFDDAAPAAGVESEGTDAAPVDDAAAPTGDAEGAAGEPDEDPVLGRNIDPRTGLPAPGKETAPAADSPDGAAAAAEPAAPRRFTVSGGPVQWTPTGDTVRDGMYVKDVDGALHIVDDKGNLANEDGHRVDETGAVLHRDGEPVRAGRIHVDPEVELSDSPLLDGPAVPGTGEDSGSPITPQAMRDAAAVESEGPEALETETGEAQPAPVSDAAAPEHGARPEQAPQSRRVSPLVPAGPTEQAPPPEQAPQPDQAPQPEQDPQPEQAPQPEPVAERTPAKVAAPRRTAQPVVHTYAANKVSEKAASRARGEGLGTRPAPLSTGAEQLSLFEAMN